MDFIRIAGVTFDQTAVFLDGCTEVLLEMKRHSPADRLTVTVAHDWRDTRFYALQATLGGEELFLGFVDSQKRVVDETGVHTTIVARSFPARMLDHEIKPGTYRQVTSAQIYDKLAKPYGVKGAAFPKKAVVAEMIAEKGTSLWAFIRQFCKLAYGRSVYIDREQKLSLSPYTGVDHVFGSMGIPFSSLSVEEDRYSILSTLYIKTDETSSGAAHYGRVLHNGVAEKFHVDRVRYYHPGKIWENDFSLAGRDVLRERQLDYLEMTLELPGIHAIRVGDTASIQDQSGGYSGLYVAEVRYLQQGSGAKTRVKCWDRQILNEG